MPGCAPPDALPQAGSDAARRTFTRQRRKKLALWQELLIALAMVPILALIHGWGLMAMSHVFNLTDEALLRKTLSPRSITLVGFVAMLLFALHAMEIGLVGLLYVAGGAVQGVEHGLVLSASYYTTTGAGPEKLPDGWRVIGQSESLLGLLLIGWSTAFLVRKIDRLEQRESGTARDLRERRLRAGTGFGGHEEEAGG